ncbi:MAG TPA: sugar transferase [Thermotogota bacterium]|nr:sugar transferase [Thermotogota bacterium]HPJ89062.1 sugar transferase [Thermotogota bacterium]HPR95124.1 sugar transferase [Thermotogota bacterium]
MLKKERFFVFLTDLLILTAFTIYLIFTGQSHEITYFIFYSLTLLLIYTSLKGFDLSRAPSPRWTMTSLSVALFLSLVLITAFSLLFGYPLHMKIWGILLYYLILLNLINPFMFRALLKKNVVHLSVPPETPEEIIARLKGHPYILTDVKRDPEVKKDLSYYRKINQILGEIPLEIYSEMDGKLFDEVIAPKRFQRKIIRLFDVIFSLLFILILIPFYVICAVLILIFQGKPVIFRQTRIGKDQRAFTLYKFRTLKVGEAKTTGIAEDHLNRSTTIGKFLRSLRLDEVPQFFNCLKGDMSLVGPRPEMIFFHEMGMKNIPNYEKRLLVKPGITGWAQTMYKRSDTLEEYYIKTGYDLSYILDYSISAYFRSLLYTLDTLIYRKT